MNSAVLTFGKVRLVNVPHAEAVAREIFDEDCYDFARVPEGAVVLDVGAFYGEFSLRCAVEKRCIVFAYEPSPANLEILQLNRKLNGYPPNFCVLARAVGRPGRRAFVSRPEHPAGSMLEDEAARHGLAGDVTAVECVSIGDEIIACEARGSTRPLVVKLDCEGAEHEIFADTRWLDDVAVLLMEWHNHDGGHFRDLVAPRGFDVRLEGGGPKPRPAWDPSIGGGLLLASRRSSP